MSINSLPDADLGWMGLLNLPPGSIRMSEEQFVAWDEEGLRAEWVDGEVIVMSPTGILHGQVQHWVHALLECYVTHFGLGEVMGPEIQIRLTRPRPQRRIPDIFFVSHDRRHIIRTNHIEGPPDMAVEIVSPDSEVRDARDKYEGYRDAGVREYWLTNPMSEHAALYVLNSGGGYDPSPERDGWLHSSVIANFRMKPNWLWPRTRPTILAALAELGVRQ